MLLVNDVFDHSRSANVCVPVTITKTKYLGDAIGIGGTWGYTTSDLDGDDNSLWLESELKPYFSTRYKVEDYVKYWDKDKKELMILLIEAVPWNYPQGAYLASVAPVDKNKTQNHGVFDRDYRSLTEAELDTLFLKGKEVL